MSEDVRINNERSLQQLAWEIEASVGNFQLILARCNYPAWQNHFVERSREICSAEIRVLVLNESEKNLDLSIRENLQGKVPAALMILGLGAVQNLSQMLISANHMQEEFRQQFPFPIVFWINNEVHKQFIHYAPDLDQLAITKHFPIAPIELVDYLQIIADKLFTGTVNLTLEDCQPIKTAWQYLCKTGKVIKEEAKANIDYLLGLTEYIHHKFDHAITYYLRSLIYWQEVNNLERQGKVLLNISLCYYAKAKKHQINYLLETQSELDENQTDEASLYRRDRQSSDTSKNHDWQATKNYLQQCLDKFADAQRPDLIATYIDKIGMILWDLQDWQQLQKLVEQVLDIHKQEENLIKISLDYCFLAKVALVERKWHFAKKLAQIGLESLSGLQTKLVWHCCLFILAKSQEQLDEIPEAISNLEAAIKLGVTDDNPLIYIEILNNLQRLYTQQKQYLKAFHTKQQRRSIEQQYGFSSFIGAGTLEATKQVKLIPDIETRCTTSRFIASRFITSRFIASLEGNTTPEITTFGRQLDIEHLVERITDNDHKLIIIHGQSRVGKSSLINAGLIPALKKKAIATQDNLVVPIRVYDNWLEDLAQEMIEALAEMGHGNAESGRSEKGESSRLELQKSSLELENSRSNPDKSTLEVKKLALDLESLTSELESLTSELESLTSELEAFTPDAQLSASEPQTLSNLDAPSPTFLLLHSPTHPLPHSLPEQLRQNEQYNLRTVLIFDQFEEFFFVCTEPKKRRRFFKFLGECLNIPSVKVILSLREDYLHYLLECNELPSMEVINRDILSRNVLYRLGNFSPLNAKTVIEHLTANTNFQLEPALIEQLVKDLAGNLDEVRPIDLQIVGAQLQTENITTLAKYCQYGENAKEKLVQRYLDEVIEDCGTENKQAAELVLFLLTDDKETRPLKTRAELERDLQQLFLPKINNVETDDGMSLHKLDLILDILIASGIVVQLRENLVNRYQLLDDYLAAFIRQQQEAKLQQIIPELEKENKPRKLSEAKSNRFFRSILIALVILGVVLGVITSIAWNAARRAEAQRKKMAPVLVLEGEKIAQQGDFDSAVAKFRQAQEWDGDLKFDPKAKAQEFVNRGKADRLIREGNNLAREGKLKEAIAAYTQVQELDAKVKISVDVWAELCIQGSLLKQATDVITACEKAVALAPNDLAIRVARGLARTQTGDQLGAIEDFEMYIAKIDDRKWKSRVRRWVRNIKAGRDPLEDAELQRLLSGENP